MTAFETLETLHKEITERISKAEKAEEKSSQRDHMLNKAYFKGKAAGLKQALFLIGEMQPLKET